MGDTAKKFFSAHGDLEKALHVARPVKHGWVEETFFLDAPTGRHRPLPESHRYLGNSFSSSYVRAAMITIIGVFCLLIGRLIMLQLTHGDAYISMAERNRQRLLPIPSERGLILDRHGVELTKNIPNFSLALIPQELPRDSDAREKVVSRLATLTHQKEEHIRAILEEYGSYSYESIIIQENLSYEEALLIHIEASDLPGISMYRGSKRLYTNGESPTSTLESGGTENSLAHILGYEGKLDRDELDQLYDAGYLPSDTIGKTGVEKAYESFLRGTYGKRRIEVNALGREQTVIAEEAPTPGSHLRLNIDVKLQNILEKVMRDELKKQGKERAVGIALDPKDGSVLAMVSLPTFNNNDFSGGIDADTYQAYLDNPDHPLFDRAIAGTYPSGSTIKPLIAAMALQEGIITPATTILSTGGITVGPWFFPDWKAGGHGITNVRYSLAWSVNTFYYAIGGGYLDMVGLGITRLSEYFTRFGLGAPTQIDVPGEASGFIPSEAWKKETLGEEWYIGDTYNTSIGQGYLLVTPIQMAAITAAIANGGTVYVPHVVRSIIDPITKKEQAIEPKIISRNVIDPTWFTVVRSGMRDCVVYGSCRRLSSLPFAVAGKTGTAEWHGEKENHAWFTSFAPSDRPEITLTILVEEGGEGADIAVPIADAFYRSWWQYRRTLVDE